MGFPDGKVVKNPPANAGNAGDMGSIPGWEDPLEKEMATLSSILTWRIPWTEEVGGLQSVWSQSQTRLRDYGSDSQVAVVTKNLPANAGDARYLRSIPGLGQSPGGGNGTLLQNSCLNNSMERGAWWATVHGAIKNQTRPRD